MKRDKALRIFGWVLFGYCILGAVYFFFTSPALEFIVSLLPVGGLGYLGWWLAHRRYKVSKEERARRGECYEG